jgi:hypothetical protein
MVFSGITLASIMLLQPPTDISSYADIGATGRLTPNDINPDHIGKIQKKRVLLKHPFVPGAGIEPARVLPHWFLRPARLPIPPSGQTNVEELTGSKGKKIVCSTKSQAS